MSVKKAFLSSTGRDLAEHRARERLERLLWADASKKEATAGFGAISHDQLVKKCRIAIEAYLGEEVHVSALHSLNEAGCDILVVFRAQALKYGIQIKSHGDIRERDFRKTTLAQIQDSRKHGLERFYVVLAGDLSNRSQSQKVYGLASDVSQMQDEYVTVVPPERAWTLLCEKPPPPVATLLERAGGDTFALQANFTGRVSERRLLTNWLTAGEHPVLGLVAIGGMGKSSVAWVWLRRDVLGLTVPGVPPDAADVGKACGVPKEARPDGAMWWSFYEGGGTFAGFLEAAMAYCSGGEKSAGDYMVESGPGARVMDYAQMQSDLLQWARQRRFLLVWDGAERLLREYGGQDAIMREEREPEEMEPDARDTLEIPVSRFLEQMAGQASSRLLVVSRLYPRVLEKLGGSRCEDLKGLAEDDAVAYLRARGIKGNRAELATAAAQYEFHPLSLSNLAADLLEDFEEEGDISAALKHDGTEKLKARQHHILERAYERRAPHRRELLCRLSAMRGTIPKEVVELLARDIPGMEPENLGRELGELVRHGLLRHPSPDRYDFHPVVRRYCYERLGDKEKIHLRLRDYFDAVPAPGKDEVRSVEDLAPVIELYHHTVGAGLYDEACELVYERLVPIPLHFRFGAYQTMIELLRALFPGGEDRPPRLKREGAQAWTLHALATSHAVSGRPRRALPLFEAHDALRAKAGDKKGLAIGLVGASAVGHLPLGELQAAKEKLQRSTRMCQDIGAAFDEAVNRQELGKLLVYQGAFEEAASDLNGSLALLTKGGLVQPQSVVWAYRALRALLMGDAEDALGGARAARGVAEKTSQARAHVESDFIRAEWLTGWALVALASEDKTERSERLAEAETHLTEALRRCRRINLVYHEPDILLAWGRWHRAKGNPDESRRHAEEALAIAERCEYRLKQAEIHNFLSRLALDEGEREAAREHAEVARERAWCDGPPHCYKPALEEAERLLGEAGLPTG